MKKTPIKKRIAILTEFWQSYYDNEKWSEVFEYADLAFPLCYAIHNKIVNLTPQAEKYIDEAWDLVVAHDTGFDNLSAVEEANAFMPIED